MTCECAPRNASGSTSSKPRGPTSSSRPSIPRPDDRFLEIGPGPGALTLRLAPRVAQLTAIELDPAMVAMLRPRLPPNVTLVQADFLDFDLAFARGRASAPRRRQPSLQRLLPHPVRADRRAPASRRDRGRDAHAAARGRRRGCTRRREAATTASSRSWCSSMPTSGRCWRCRPGRSARCPRSTPPSSISGSGRPPSRSRTRARSKRWSGRCSGSGGRCC